MQIKSRRNRILLGQLVKNGDCLHATILARQIKKDFPGCHLTWAVSSLCRRTIENNPDVDEIWEVPLRSWENEHQAESWLYLEQEALRLYAKGRFDFIFFTQIHLANHHLFDGTIRPSLFRAYPGKITVPLRPVIDLSEVEASRVRDFAEKHLRDFERVILFESSPQSAQSPMNPETALLIAHGILDAYSGRYAVICSAQNPVQGPVRPGLIDGSTLSLREMAGLTEYCDLFIGSNSGITQAITATGAKSLPMIQILSSARSIYSSLAYDLRYWSLSDATILELFDADAPGILRVVKDYFALGWERTRKMHHQNVKVDFTYLISFLRNCLINQNDLMGFTMALRNATERYGWHEEFDDLLRETGLKFLPGSHEQPKYDREEVFRRLEARALEPDSYGDLQSPFRTSQFFKLYPMSLREKTCLIRLKRNAREIDKALASFLPPESVDPKKIRTLILDEDDDALCLEHKKQPDNLLYRGALVLVLVQSGQYEKATDFLRSWQSEPDRISHFLLEEWQGDLAWMRGEHNQVEEHYRSALRLRPSERNLEQKLEALLRVQSPKPDHESESLSQVGLVLYEKKVRPDFSSKQMRRLTELSSCGWIDGALLGDDQGITETTDKNVEPLSLKPISGHARELDAKTFLVTALQWAKKRQKKWLILAHDTAELDDFAFAQLRAELEENFHPERPYSWKINRAIQEIPFALSRRDYFYPCLLILPTDWTERHLKEFGAYSLKNDRWLLAYSAKILHLIDEEKLYQTEDIRRGIRAKPATSLDWVFPAALSKLALILKNETVMVLAWKLTEFRYNRRMRIKARQQCPA